MADSTSKGVQNLIKLERVIESAKTREQLQSAFKYTKLWIKKYSGDLFLDGYTKGLLIAKLRQLES